MTVCFLLFRIATISSKRTGNELTPSEGSSEEDAALAESGEEKKSDEIDLI